MSITRDLWKEDEQECHSEKLLASLRSHCDVRRAMEEGGLRKISELGEEKYRMNVREQTFLIKIVVFGDFSYLLPCSVTTHCSGKT